jgi:hypothetical protein
MDAVKMPNYSDKQIVAQVQAVTRSGEKHE